MHHAFNSAIPIASLALSSSASSSALAFSGMYLLRVLISHFHPSPQYRDDYPVYHRETARDPLRLRRPSKKLPPARTSTTAGTSIPRPTFASFERSDDDEEGATLLALDKEGADDIEEAATVALVVPVEVLFEIDTVVLPSVDLRSRVCPATRSHPI
jgi:hypothetical protein